MVSAWLVWLIVAAVLAAGEASTGTFYLLMTAGGALGGAGAAALGAPVVIQVLVGIIVTLGLVWLVRPIAIRHAHPGPAAITGTDALVGMEAVVLAEVTGDGGRVKLNGGEWSARSRDPAQVLEIGARVHVVAIDGATAVVRHDPLYL